MKKGRGRIRKKRLILISLIALAVVLILGFGILNYVKNKNIQRIGIEKEVNAIIQKANLSQEEIAVEREKIKSEKERELQDAGVLNALGSFFSVKWMFAEGLGVQSSCSSHADCGGSLEILCSPSGMCVQVCNPIPDGSFNLLCLSDPSKQNLMCGDKKIIVMGGAEYPLCEPDPDSCFDRYKDPVPVCSYYDLKKAQSIPDSNFILNKDIDAGGKSIYPFGQGIGYGDFVYTHTFNGNNHKISNLNINNPTVNFVGLFYKLSPGSIVKDLTLENVNVVGNLPASGSYSTGVCVGILAGDNAGIIDNVKVQGGSITKTDGYLGGLVGCNGIYNGPGLIKNSNVNGVKISKSENNGGNTIGAIVGNAALNIYTRDTTSVTNTCWSNSLGDISQCVGNDNSANLIWTGSCCGGCISKTCADLVDNSGNQRCGTLDNGCEETITCSCSYGQICKGGVCSVYECGGSTLSSFGPFGGLLLKIPFFKEIAASQTYRECEDNDPCTEDSCNLNTNRCINLPVLSGDSCTNGEGTCCSGSCVKTETDNNNCGVCENACNADESCWDSECMCHISCMAGTVDGFVPSVSCGQKSKSNILCKGNCGSCPAGWICTDDGENPKCVNCNLECLNADYSVKDNSCGANCKGSCGKCKEGEICDKNGICAITLKVKEVRLLEINFNSVDIHIKFSANPSRINLFYKPSIDNDYKSVLAPIPTIIPESSLTLIPLEPGSTYEYYFEITGENGEVITTPVYQFATTSEVQPTPTPTPTPTPVPSQSCTSSNEGKAVTINGELGVCCNQQFQKGKTSCCAETCDYCKECKKSESITFPVTIPRGVSYIENKLPGLSSQMEIESASSKIVVTVPANLKGKLKFDNKKSEETIVFSQSAVASSSMSGSGSDNYLCSNKNPSPEECKKEIPKPIPTPTGCKSDSDCQECQTCNTETGYCINVNDGITCTNGVCCSGTCLTGKRDCPNCGESINNKDCTCVECNSNIDDNTKKCPEGKKCCPSEMFCNEEGKCKYECEKDEDCNGEERNVKDGARDPRYQICENHKCIKAECGYKCSTSFLNLGNLPRCQGLAYPSGSDYLQGCNKRSSFLGTIQCINHRCNEKCKTNEDCLSALGATGFGKSKICNSDGKCVLFNSAKKTITSPVTTSQSCQGGACPIGQGKCETCPCPYVGQIRNQKTGKCECSESNQKILNPDSSGEGTCECVKYSNGKPILDNEKILSNGICSCKDSRALPKGGDMYTCECGKSQNNVQLIKNNFGFCGCPDGQVEIGGTEDSVGKCICINGGGDSNKNCEINPLISKSCSNIRETTYTPGQGLTKSDCPQDKTEKILRECKKWTCENYGDSVCGDIQNSQSQSQSVSETNPANSEKKMKCGVWPDGCGGMLDCKNTPVDCPSKYICMQEKDGSQKVYKQEGYCKLSSDGKSSQCVYDSQTQDTPKLVLNKDCGQCGYCKELTISGSIPGLSGNPNKDTEICTGEYCECSIDTTAEDILGGSISGNIQTQNLPKELFKSNNEIICVAMPEDSLCQGPEEKKSTCTTCKDISPYVCKSSTASASTETGTNPSVTGKAVAQPGDSNYQPGGQQTSSQPQEMPKCVRKKVTAPKDCYNTCDLSKEAKSVADKLRDNLCSQVREDVLDEIMKFQNYNFNKDKTKKQPINEYNVGSYLELALLGEAAKKFDCTLDNGGNQINDPLLGIPMTPKYQLDKIKLYYDDNNVRDENYINILNLLEKDYEDSSDKSPNVCAVYLKEADKIYKEHLNFLKTDADKSELYRKMAQLEMKKINCYMINGDKSFLHSPEKALEYAQKSGDNAQLVQIKRAMLDMMIFGLDQSIVTARKKVSNLLPNSLEQFNLGSNPNYPEVWQWVRNTKYLVYNSPYARNTYNCLFGSITRADADAMISQKTTLVLSYRDGFETLRTLLDKAKMEEYCKLESSDYKNKFSILNQGLGLGMSSEELDRCYSLGTDIGSKIGKSFDERFFGLCKKINSKQCNADFACSFSDVQGLVYNKLSGGELEGNKYTSVTQFKFMGMDPNPYSLLKNNPYELLNNEETQKIYDEIYNWNFATFGFKTLQVAGALAGANSLMAATSIWQVAGVLGTAGGFIAGSTVLTNQLNSYDPQAGEFAAELFNTALFLPSAVAGTKAIVSFGKTSPKPSISIWFADEAKLKNFLESKGLSSENTGEGISGNYLIEGKPVRLGWRKPATSNPGEVELPKTELENLAKKIEECKKRASENPECPANAQGEGQCPITEPGSGCFLANTQIQMANGESKSIQDIFVGEKVTAFDLATNKPTNAEVTTTFVRPETSYRIIEYETVN